MFKEKDKVQLKIGKTKATVIEIKTNKLDKSKIVFTIKLNSGNFRGEMMDVEEKQIEYREKIA